MVEITELMDVTETKKRKKKLKNAGEEMVVKKKKKTEKGNKEDAVDDTGETKEIRKKKKIKSSDLSKPVDDDEKKIKKKLSKSTKKDGLKSKVEKTMDYKQFHLKRMKEKWKNNNAKRIRPKKDEKTTDEQPKTKKAKREEKLKLKQKPSEKATKETKKFGTCDFSELLHYWNEFSASSLTAVEREELKLDSKKLILNEKGRTPAKFLSKNIPDWSEWMEKKIPNGSPQMIVLCSSALRVVELNRNLKPFKGKCRTLKLITRDKAKSQAESLAKSVVNFAIGTPHRIDLLLSHDNMKLNECRIIALDWSFEDVKKRRLITIPEIRKDILELFRKHFLPALKNRNDISLILF